MVLEHFSDRTREWFEAAFAAPTAAQEQAWPAIASGEHVLLSAPTGSGKTLAAFLWAIDRLAAEKASGDAERPPGHRTALRLAAQGALLRHRPQPARAPARDRRRADRRRADRRHAAARAPGDAAPGARHPHHHPRVALPDADRPRAGAVCRARAGASSTRSTPSHRPSAARTSRSPSSGSARRPGATCSASGCGRPRIRSRRSPASWSARADSAGSSTPACARSSTSRSTCRSSRWSSPTPRLRPSSTRWPAARPPGARSGPRSIRSCSSSSARTARRSSSSTTAAAPSAWRCA